MARHHTYCLDVGFGILSQRCLVAERTTVVGPSDAVHGEGPTRIERNEYPA